LKPNYRLNYHSDVIPSFSSKYSLDDLMYCITMLHKENFINALPIPQVGPPTNYHIEDITYKGHLLFREITRKS
jgi:hypothetical protein